MIKHGIGVGDYVLSSSDYMRGWTGFVIGFGSCHDPDCADSWCAAIVEWTLPGDVGERTTMRHMPQSLRRQSPLQALADQS